MGAHPFIDINPTTIHSSFFFLFSFIIIAFHCYTLYIPTITAAFFFFSLHSRDSRSFLFCCIRARQGPAVLSLLGKPTYGNGVKRMEDWIIGHLD